MEETRFYSSLLATPFPPFVLLCFGWWLGSCAHERSSPTNAGPSASLPPLLVLLLKEDTGGGGGQGWGAAGEAWWVCTEVWVWIIKNYLAFQRPSMPPQSQDATWKYFLTQNQRSSVSLHRVDVWFWSCRLSLYPAWSFVCPLGLEG